MSINALCQHELRTIHEAASLNQAASLMKSANVGSLVVVQEEGSKKPVGILTDRDIVMYFADSSQKIHETKVKDIMTKELLTVSHKDGIKETMDAMASKGVRRVPVVNDNNEICGVVSLDDFLVLLSEENKRISEIIAKQNR